MADNRGLYVSISLAQADAIIDIALKTGRDMNLQRLTIAVLDVGGHLVALKREDGSGILRPQIAIAKAWAALGLGDSSRAIGERLAERQAFQAQLAAVSDGRFIAVPGGVLACDSGGTILGAVGVTGDTSDNDEACAIAGIKAAGLSPRPGR